MNIAGQPGLDEIEQHFVAVLDGRLSRDQADRWAARWLADSGLSWEDLAWWALDLLHGVDLTTGPDGPFLHDDEQLRAWLHELRRRRSTP